jgi:hypothetical protein
VSPFPQKTTRICGGCRWTVALAIGDVYAVLAEHGYNLLWIVSVIRTECVCPGRGRGRPACSVDDGRG